MQTKRWNLWGRLTVALLAFLLAATAEVAFAATEKLDENEEVQWVMGDLSALKTAAQTYYSDNSNPAPPPVSAILNYFEPGSVSPNASALYTLKGDDRGWYVGYQAIGLKNETYRLLQANAEVLGLLGDDLRTPWRYGSRYFWAEALALSPTAGSASNSGTTTVIKQDSDLADAAALVVATAALVSIIADNDNDRYYYYVPGYNWYWNSGMVYRPVYYNRFFRYYYRPLPVPPPYYPPPRYRWRAPRAGWLDPNWRRSYDYAHRWYNPRYDDRRLDAHYPDRRWRDDRGRGSLPPPPPPPSAGRLRPRNPNFRGDPPPGIRPPHRDDRPHPDGDFRRPGQSPRRPDDRPALRPRHPGYRPPRPDGRSTPERRPDRPRPPGDRSTPGVRPPSQVPRPDNRPKPEMRRPDRLPARPGERGGSPEVRRPQPRPDGPRQPEMRRPEQRPRPGNRPAPEVRRPQPGRPGNGAGNAPSVRRQPQPRGNAPQTRPEKPSSGNRRPQAPRGQPENAKFRR